MPGPGTGAPASAAEPPARLLDLTRLVSRAGRRAWTGIDRVEAAYLGRLSARPAPLWALARIAGGSVLLAPEGVQALAARLAGTMPWGWADIEARLRRRGAPLRARAEADLRRLARARARDRALASMLARHLPAGTHAFNVGHANLNEASLGALPHATLTVMIHDTIPLDHPEFCRPGTAAAMRARLDAAARHADRIVCISADTAGRLTHHLGAGPCPPVTVARPGIAPAAADRAALPPGLPPAGPYFVTVGTIEPRKNHALLLDLWERLTRAHGPDAPTLVIAGARGWRNAQVFARLDARPAGVVEAEGLGDGALSALVAGSRGLLFPSLAEGFGMPPLEARALGVPAVVADLAVYRESLGPSAIYASPAAPYGWLEIIEALLRNEKRFERPDPPGIPTWDAHFAAVLDGNETPCVKPALPGAEWRA